MEDEREWQKLEEVAEEGNMKLAALWPWDGFAGSFPRLCVTPDTPGTIALRGGASVGAASLGELAGAISRGFFLSMKWPTCTCREDFTYDHAVHGKHAKHG